MKARLMFVLMALTTSAAFASTTLTINTSDFTGANPVTSIRIDLQNCSNARLSGTGQIVPQTQTIAPVAGVAHITLFSNTDPTNNSAIILCQTPSGQQAVSYYSFSFIFQGVITGVGSYNLIPGTFNLIDLTPCVGPACIGNGSGGVTRIIAGQNINITPTNGLGQVTINADETTIIPGANIGCTPFIAGSCKGAVTITGTGGGGGAANPTAPGGTGQAGNAGSTAFTSDGMFQVDAFGNIAAGFADSNCITVHCFFKYSPLSTNTEAATAMGYSTGKISSYLQDNRGNVNFVGAVNPQIGNYNIFFPGAATQSQSLNPGFLEYTEASPSTTQGAGQSISTQETLFSAPGFSIGPSAFLTPGPGHTSVGAWAGFNGYNDFMSFNSAGIRNVRNSIIGFFGVGDCQGTLSSANFVTYSGGWYAPADEGCHLGTSIHTYTTADAIGTMTSLTDPNHILVNFTSSASTQGQGRFLIDLTNIPLGTDSVAMNLVPADSEDVVSHPIPVIISNNAHFPVSTAYGTLAGDCAVAVQEGGLAPATCNITLVSGQFCLVGSWNGSSCTGSTTQLICLAANVGGQFNIGVVATSVSVASGSSQTLIMPIHNSVQAGGIIFQGGTCGMSIDLAGDGNTGEAQNGGLVLGSVFPSLGTYDAHTVTVLNFAATGSSEWNPVPNPGSQWGTRATFGTAHLGFTAANLNVTSNVLSFNVTSSLQQVPPLYQVLNGTEFMGIEGSAGCSGGSLDISGVPAFTNMPGPDPTVVNVPYTHANATCTSATVFMQNTTINLKYAANIYDVVNHTTGAVDGTMAISQQPGFHNGDTLDTPTHYSASTDIMKLNAELAQPQVFSSGINLFMRNHSAYEGAAITIAAESSNFALHGFAGIGIPTQMMVGEGIFSNAFVTDTQPTAGGILFGKPSGLWPTNSTNYAFRRFCMIGTDAQLTNNYQEAAYVAPNCIAWDDDQQAFQFSWNAILGTPSIQFAQFLNSFGAPTRFTNTQWELFQNATNTGGFADTTTQFRICDNRNTSVAGIFTPCYQRYIPSTAVVGHVGTIGATTYNYGLVVNDEAGPSVVAVYATSTGNATLNTSNYNTIPCTDLPSGKTGFILVFDNPNWFQLPSNTCSSSSTVVLDQGTAGSVAGPDVYAAGITYYSGAFAATGVTGGFRFTQPDIYGISTPATTITAGISQVSAGVLSVDTTTQGDGLGIIKAASVQTGPPGTYASLIARVTCGSGTAGSVAAITDPSTVTWGAIVTGGGAGGSYALINCNGSNWTVVGK